MIKAIIFDADGMIVHGERFSSRLERIHGISTEITRIFFATIFQQCLIGEADLKEELPKYIKEWGYNGTLDSLLQFWFSGDEIEGRFEEVINNLRYSGIKCYLATNNEKYRTKYLTDERGWGKWFDGIFSSSSVGSKKPEHEFFNSILNEISPIKKEEILFWDDDSENIEGAKKFGLKTETYTNFEDFKKTISKLYKQ